MTVGELCTRRVVIATRTESLVEAARRMREHHVGDLVVVDDAGGRRTPVGIVTDRDIVIGAVAEPVRDLGRLTVADVMTADPVTARTNDSMLDALKKMRSHGIRRLPVVNETGVLEGILTFDDLLDVLSEELGDLAALVARGQTRERAVRA
jgi:CBS domain-containing protein